MNPRKKRLMYVGLGVFVIGLTLVSWTTVKVVAWFRDIPNRIVIDGDAAIARVGEAVTEYYHDALENGDSTLQLQVINDQFIPMVDKHREAATWIHNEYHDDILALLDSSDVSVSAAASNLMARLDAEIKSNQQ